MTIAPLLLAWILLAPALLGVLVLHLCGWRPQADRLGYVAWLWPAGCAALALALLACLLLGIPPAHWTWAPIVLGGALAVLARSRFAAAAAPPTAPRHSQVLRVVVGVGALWCLLHIGAAACHPCVLGDEANWWATKAKSLYADWYVGEFAAAQAFTLHADYPLLNPLLQAWVYSQAGSIVHYENRLPIQLCSLSLWLATAAALRRHCDGWLAALLLLPLLLGLEFEHMSNSAHADGMVALGMVLAVDGWLRGRESPHRTHRALLALGLTFALWSKNEGLVFVAIAAATALVAALLRRGPRARPGAEAAWLLLPLAVALGQFAWNRWFGFGSDLMGEGVGSSFGARFVGQFTERAPVVLRAAAEVVFDFGHAHCVLLLPFLALLLAPRLALSRTLLVPTVTLALGFVAVHLVYIGSYLVLDFHLATSQRRVLAQLVPAALVWFAALWAAARAQRTLPPA